MGKILDKLKNSLIFRYLGLTGIILIVIQSSLAIAHIRWDYKQRLISLEQKVEDTAQFLAATSQQATLQLDDLTLENLLSKLSTDTTLVYCWIVDAQGNVLNGFLDRQMPAIASTLAQQTIEPIKIEQIAQTLKQNPNIREVYTPIGSVSHPLGEIRIGYSLEGLQQEKWQAIQTTLATALASSVLSMALIAFLYGREIYSPMKKLAAQAIAASEGAVKVTGKNEFEQLKNAIEVLSAKIQTIKEMRQSIAEREEIEKHLENLHRGKGELLATLSHEIRTPLNAVAGMTGLLLDTKLTDEQKEFVDIIRISGERLLTTIDNILDFSKIEANKLELDEQFFELGECIEESLRLFLSQASEKELELAYLVEPQTPMSLISDETRLRQILLNLLGNAVKFTHTGEVVVYVNATPQAASTNNGNGQQYEIRFAVKDTGIGIPSERIDRLFQSFNQVDASTTSKYGGTGLGLAISKQLCEMMGGKMWVHSTVGKGSTFYFTILAKAAPNAIPASFQEAQQDLVGKRMLIVDDNTTNQKILTLQAQSWGMFTCAVESGAKALEWLQRGVTFDIALLDMQLPNMDGISLAREIRKQPQCQKLPLVLLSSLNKQDYRRGEDINFAAILSKPIQQSQLYNVLLQIFTGRPLKVIAPSITPAKPKPLAASLPLRILVVEDVEIDRKTIRLLLEKLGYRADLAGNGIEALKALRRQYYDVVLMDVKMPQMDGIAATRQICQEKATSMRPRIIAMTAAVAPGDREKCSQAGMDDFLAKPISLEELRKILMKSAQKTRNTKVFSETEWKTCGEEATSARILPTVPRSDDDAFRSEEICPPHSSLHGGVSLDCCQILPADGTIDAKTIELLQNMVRYQSPAMVVSRIENYLRDAPLKLAAIAVAIDNRDERALQQATRALRTISVNLGANRLDRLCHQLEANGYSYKSQEVFEQISEIEFEYEKVCQSWRQALRQLSLENSTL
jgi:signal transduction histidine kinase/DNA-binding response OmpR family regulator/HPt (histidine-containing phosphotransfer) domain-containing protein